MITERGYDELVAEADAADVTGWGFGWLEGRATEERPPWGYARLLAERLAQAEAALDLDTGGGEVVGEAPVFPPRLVVTESYGPNAAHARANLGPRGAEVVRTRPGAPLPFPDASFDLVTSRHPVAPDWPEIRRVLVPGGTYVAQHVGPESAAELIERFVTLTPENRRARHPDDEAAAATAAGLEIDELRTARCRMEFFDIGAVVWTLRKCVWWVPEFSVTRYDRELRDLDREIRAHGSFVAHSTRHLVRAHRR